MQLSNKLEIVKKITKSLLKLRKLAKVNMLAKSLKSSRFLVFSLFFSRFDGDGTLQKLLLWAIVCGYGVNICNIKCDGVNKCKARGVRKKCEKGSDFAKKRKESKQRKVKKYI